MYQLSVILQICRFSLAFLWMYQGLVPKLMYTHVDELTMNQSIQPFWLSSEQLATAAGWFELAFGILLFIAYRKKWIYKFTIFSMLGLLGFVAVMTPQFLTSAFNAVTLNISAIAIALVALVCLKDNDYEWSFYE